MGADCVIYIGRTLLKSLVGYSAERAVPNMSLVHFANGKQAWAAASRMTPSLIIINAADTRTSGHRLCMTARRAWPNVPVLVLASEGREVPQADCVLQTPFTPLALFQMMNMILSSEYAAPRPDHLVTAGPFTLDTTLRLLSIRMPAGSERTHVLRPKEANLLRFFLQHPGQIIDRKTLMAAVWQTDYLGDTRTLNVHVRALRIHLEADPSHPIFLQTARGQGYRFVAGNLPN